MSLDFIRLVLINSAPTPTVNEILGSFMLYENDFKALGVALTAEKVVAALDGCYGPRAEGKVGSGKHHHYPDKAEYPKLHGGAIIGHIKDRDGKKDTMAWKLVHREHREANTGRRTVSVTMLISDMLINDWRVLMDFTAGSAWRTAYFGHIYLSIITKPGEKLKVTIKGSGDITGKILEIWNEGLAGRIECVRLISEGGTSNYKMSERLGPKVDYPIVPTQDDGVITPAKTDLLVTNANNPIGTYVCTPEQVEGIKHIWSNGVEDIKPEAAWALLLKGAFFIYDGIEEALERQADFASIMIRQHNIDWKNGPYKNQFVTMADIHVNPGLAQEIRDSGKPTVFIPVGTADIDLTLAEAHLEEIKNALANMGFRRD